MRDPTVLAVLVAVMFVWLVVATTFALRLYALVRDIVRQLGVHAAVLSNTTPRSEQEQREAEMAAVREWQEGLRAEKPGSPRHQAYAARLRSRGIAVDD